MIKKKLLLRDCRHTIQLRNLSWAIIQSRKLVLYRLIYYNYNRKGILQSINADRAIEEVWRDVYKSMI